MTAQQGLATTRAYVVESAGAPFILRDVVLTDLQPSEVLVEMKYTGLCHTVGSNSHEVLRRVSNTNITSMFVGYRCPARWNARRPFPRCLWS